MPTLRALECLVTACDTGSITIAAQQLQASQPAVSHQLAALESELGVSLLQRLPRGVVPTAAGRSMLVHARLALSSAQRAEKAARASASGAGGELRIGCAASMMISVLPPVLRGWNRSHPGVSLQIVESESADELQRLLAAGAVDVVVSPQGSAVAEQQVLIGVEPLVLALPRRHPLAQPGTPVPLSQLHGLRMVGLDPHNGLAGWIDGLLAAAQVKPEMVLRSRQAVVAAQLAAAGLGVALVPGGAVSADFAGALRQLAPAVQREVYAVTAGPADALAQRFVSDLLRCGIRLPANMKA